MPMPINNLKKSRSDLEKRKSYDDYKNLLNFWEKLASLPKKEHSTAVLLNL